MTSTRYKTTLMYIYIVHLRGISLSEFPKMFGQTRKCQSNWQKANDKFLRINAWQESMKRLLTFTLLQSRDGKWKFLHLQPSLPPFILDRKLIFSKTKEKPREEVKTMSVRGKHTHCFFAYVSS